MKFKKYDPTISILGSSGGVAKAILSILDKSVQDINDPIHSFVSRSQIHLIDHKQKKIDCFQKLFPCLIDKLILNQFDLKDTDRFKDHLRLTKTSFVIDVSYADTVEMLDCCNELGVYYVNTALESTKVDENEDLGGFTLFERYKIFKANKNKFTNTTGIVCSGMNPGVVQWMVIEMIKKY